MNKQNSEKESSGVQRPGSEMRGEQRNDDQPIGRAHDDEADDVQPEKETGDAAPALPGTPNRSEPDAGDRLPDDRG